MEPYSDDAKEAKAEDERYVEDDNHKLYVVNLLVSDEVWRRPDDIKLDELCKIIEKELDKLTEALREHGVTVEY